SAVREGFDVVVAVGGDGTLNQVANGLKHSQTAMGIIPMGSGNGLARHLGIPLRTPQAIHHLNRMPARKMDTLLMNGKTFVNMAGTGFDAHIGHLFATAGSRGFRTYAQITIKELLNYKPQGYEIELDGKKLTEEAFLISFANGSQWGNNAIIAPHASVSDGLIDLSLMRPFKWHQVPSLALKMFNSTIDHSSLI